MTSNIQLMIERHESEIARLKAILEAFPDAKIWPGRWRQWIYSPSVNGVATHLYVRHSCGCCPDPAVVAMPYVEFGEDRIYSHPPEIYVGTVDHVSGADIWEKDWRKKLAAHKISDAVIALAGMQAGEGQQRSDES